MGADESKPETVILLLGKTGDGKSSTGNTILGKQIFKSVSSPNSETEEATWGYNRVDGRFIKVIDTAGIFDTRNDDKNIIEHLIRSLVECAQGPHILTIVLKVGRYTLQEEETEGKIWEYFKEVNFQQSVILFTHGEDLEGQTIEEFVNKSPKLQELVNKCEGSCHVIDNKHWNKRFWGYRSNRVQVKKLLETIKKKGESSCYTNELLQIVQEEIQKETENIQENLSPEEKQARAKEKVFKKLIYRLAGVTAGVLTGALLGLSVPVASVVALLKGTIKSATATNAKAETTAETEAELAEVGEAELETSSICPLISETEAEIAMETEAVMAVGATVTGLGAAAAAVGAAVVDASITAGALAGAAAVEAGVATGAAAAVGAAVVDASITAGAVAGAAAEAGVATAGAVAAEAGVAAGAGIGAAAGTGIAAGVILGAAALAGAVGGGITGYKAAEEADSVLDAMKMAAKANYENVKGVVEKVEQFPSNVREKFQK